MTEPSNTVNAITSFNLEYTTIKLPSKVRRLSSLSQDAQDCLCEDKVVDEEYQFPGNWDTGPEELAMFFKPKAINKVGNYNYWYYGYMWYSYYGYFYNPTNGTPTPSLNSNTGWFKTGSTLFDFNPSFKYNDVPSPEYVKIVLNKTANVFEEYSDIPSLYFYSTSQNKHYGVKKEIQRKCWAGRGTLGSDEVIVIVSPFGGLYQTQRKFYSELSYAYFDSTSSTYTYVICYLNSKAGIFPPGDLCENPYCVVSVGFFGGGYSDSFGLAYITQVNEGYYWNNASNSGFSTYYFDSASSRQTFKSVNNTVNETTSYTSLANEIPFLYSFTSPLTIAASGSISGPAYYNSEYIEVIAGKQYVRTTGNFLYEFDPLFASLPSKAFFWSFSSNFVNYLNSTLYGNTCVAGRPILIEKEESEGSYGSLKTVPTGHPLTGSITTGSVFEEFWWQSRFQSLSVEYPAFAGASPCTYPFTIPPQPNFKQFVLTPFMSGQTGDAYGPLPDVPLAVYDHIGKHVFSVNGDGSEYYSIITEEQNLEQGAGLDGTSNVCITANPANPQQCGFPSYYYPWGNATVRVRLNGTLKAKLYKRQYFNPPYYFPQTKVVVEDLDPPYYKAHRSDFKSQLYWHPVDTSGSYETYYKPSDAVVSYKVIGTDEKITLPFPLYNRALSYYSNLYSGNYTYYCQNYWLPILSTRKIKSKVLFSQFALEGLIPNGGFKYPSTLTDAMVRIYPVPTSTSPPPPAIPGYPTVGVTTVSEFNLDEVSDSSYPQYFYLASDFSKLVAYKFPISAYKNIYAMTLYATYGYSYMPSSFLNLKQAVKLDEFKLIPESSPSEFYTSVVQQSEANQALYHLAKLSNSIAYAPSVLGWYYYQGWYNPYSSLYLNSILSEIDFKGLKDYYNNMYPAVGKSTVGILFDKDRGPVQTFMTEPYLWSTLGIGGDASNFQNNKDALSWIKNLSIPEQKSSFYLLDNSVYLEAGTLVLDTFNDREPSNLCWIYQGYWNTPYNTSQLGQKYPVSYFGTRGFHDTLSIENHQMFECSNVVNGVRTNGPPMTTGSESGKPGFVKIGLSYSLKNPKEIAEHIAAVYRQASDSYSAKISAAAPYLIYYWPGSVLYGYKGIGYRVYDSYPVYSTACDYFWYDGLPHTTSPVTVNTFVQFIYPSGSNSSYTSVNDYQYGWRSTTAVATGSFTNSLCTILSIKVKMEPNNVSLTPGYVNIKATGTYFPKDDPILEQKFLCDSLSGLSLQSTTLEPPYGFHTTSQSYGGFNYNSNYNMSNDYRTRDTTNLSYYNISMLNSFNYFGSPIGIKKGYGENPKIGDPNFKGDAVLHLDQGSFSSYTSYISQVKYNVDMAPLPYPNLHPNPIPYPDTNSYNQPIINSMSYPGAPGCYTSSANAYPGSTGYCTNTGNSVSTLRSSCSPWDVWNPGCNYTHHYDGTKIYESEYNCESNVNACPLGHSKEFIHNWFNPPAIPPIDYVIRFGFEHTGSV